MNTPITNKEIPIQKIWILKTAILMFAIQIVAVPLFVFLPPPDKGFAGYDKNVPEQLLICFVFFIIITIYSLISSFLIRKSLRYSFEEDAILVTTGVLIKNEQKIPYSEIVAVKIERRWEDKLLGISSLIFKKRRTKPVGILFPEDLRPSEIWWAYHIMPGWNMSVYLINLPGLLPNDAEKLKEFIEKRNTLIPQ